MGFLKFQNFIKILKKKNNLIIFSFTFVFLALMFVYGNNTFLKKKLSYQYSILFDYDYHYSYINQSRKATEYANLINKINNSIAIQGTGGTSSILNKIPYSGIIDLHENFWELIYKFNLTDTKSPLGNKNYDIANSFKIDTLNFKFKNKKLHIGWNNIQEAENYILTLHNRSIIEIKNIIEFIYKENNKSIKQSLMIQMLLYPENILKEKIMNTYKLQSDNEFFKLIQNTVDDFKLIGLDDIDIFRIVYFNNLNSLPLNYGDLVNFFNKGSNDEIDTTIKKKVLHYYLTSKYDPSDFMNTDLDFFYEIKDYLNNIDKYIPEYKIRIKKVSSFYIYLIELLIAIMIPFIILFTFEASKRLKINKKRK